MAIQVQHQVGSETVTVQVDILKAFEECKEDMKSPFKHMKQVNHPDFNPNNYENVFIKCEILPEHRIHKLLSHQVSGESVCHEVVNKFMKEKYPGKQFQQIESVFCNHFEMQYQYVVI